MSSSPLWRSAFGRLRSLRLAWPAGWGSIPLPPLADLRAYLPAFSSRTAWLLYTLACFSLFVLLTFPSHLLLRRVIASMAQDSAVRVRYAEGDWTWEEGWVLRDLTIEGPVPGVVSLRLARLILQPSLFGLLSNQRPLPLTFSADLYGGTLSGTVRQAAVGLSARLALRHLALDQWPLPTPWGRSRMAGNITADGAFQGNPADLTSVQGSVTLTLTDGALRAGTVARLPLPALQTVQAHLRATLAGGQLEVSDLTLSAEGVEARVQGVITLRTPLVWSVLDLQLTTQLTGSPPPALATLLSLLPASPGAAGERRASITGSLAAPAVQ